MKVFPYSISSSRGRSSAGRALDWQSRGQGFDPPRLHHRECKGSRESEGLFHDHSPWGIKPLPHQQKVAQFIPMSVHNLLAKYYCWCTSPLHLGSRNVLCHCSHRNYLRQLGQVYKLTLFNIADQRYVVQHNPNQFRQFLVLGYLRLHEFNCAHGSNKP